MNKSLQEFDYSRDVDLEGQKREVYKQLKGYASPITSRELAVYELQNWQVSTVRARLKELRDLELIENKEKRKCRVADHNRSVNTWMVKK